MGLDPIVSAKQKSETAPEVVPEAQPATVASFRLISTRQRCPPTLPPRTLMVRARLGGYISSISSLMGTRYDSAEEADFEYLQARMSGL